MRFCCSWDPKARPGWHGPRLRWPSWNWTTRASSSTWIRQVTWRRLSGCSRALRTRAPLRRGCRKSGSGLDDHRAGQARAGVAGGLGPVVVRVAVDDQALAHDVGTAAAQRDRAGLEAEGGHAVGIGLQALKVADVMR